MELLGFLRIGLTLVTATAMFVLGRKLDSLPVRGVKLVWTGVGLLVLHMLVGSIYHSELIREPWLREYMPYLGFVTGYIGQTIGLIAIPLGAHSMIKTFSPQLRESLRYHEEFVHSLNGIVYEINSSDFRFTFVSDGCRNLLGYSREYWLENITWDRIIHPDDLDRVINYCSAAIQENRNHTIEFRALRSDGRVIWLRDVSAVIQVPGEPGKVRGVLMDITDHVDKEAALLKSEHKYRTLVEHMNEGLLQVTNEDVIVFASPRFCEMMGYGTDELIGTVANEILVPEEYRSVITRKNEERKNEVADSYEIPMVRKSGERIWVLISGAPVKGPDGSVVGSMGILSDITERKRLELENQSAIAQIKNLFENLNEMFFSYDTIRHRLLMISPACEKIYGRTQDEFYGNSSLWKEIVHREDRTMVESFEKQLFAGTPAEWEHRVLHTDGSIRWVESKVTPSFDENGVLVRIDGIATDISDRKTAEAALLESEERYRGLVEQARDTILTISTDGFITSLNRAFEVTTNHKRQDWIGRSFTDILHPDDVTKAIDALTKAVHGEPNDMQEFRVRAQSGEYITIEVTSTHQAQNEGSSHLLVIARDITSRKQLEENLRQTQKMEGLGTLASGIAHDFNNILGIIMTHASLLENPSTRDALLEKGVEAINKAVRRGAHLVSQILTLARKTEFSPRALDPTEAVHEVSRMIKETFPKTIEIVEDLSVSDRSIVADSTQVLQCLLNLAVNARDAMNGKGILTFRTDLVPRSRLAEFPNLQSEEYVVISVSDTGSGMDEKTLQRVFEPFFTTKEPGKGTGMGLAMVYGIMQGHGGFVDVESAVGVGTTFRLYFPATNDFPERSEENLAPTPDSLKGSETILVAEDEPLLAELVHTLLEGNGYEVCMAHDGEEALDLFQGRRHEIDIVISDLGLPKLNGVDLTRKLLELNPETKIIVASGYLAPESRSELEGQGITEFLSKPYKAGELFEAIRRVMEGSRARIASNLAEKTS
ncbi:MAG: PAS domain S-box protein [Ignavibacteriales bacterium]|nr:PAS domain S-box protein [Ignavibacteriales bacterium]